jgi:hypothetical protein
VRRASWFRGVPGRIGRSSCILGLPGSEAADHFRESELMNKGRSKGVCVALGFQDIHGMKSVYGAELALELVGQCSNKVLLRLESAETAKWASETVGQYEEIQVLESQSRDSAALMRGQRTRSEQRVTRDLVMPSEFLGVPVTNARSGLTGYYLSPFVGVYRRTLPLVSFLSGGGRVRAGLPRASRVGAVP